MNRQDVCLNFFHRIRQILIRLNTNGRRRKLAEENSDVLLMIFFGNLTCSQFIVLQLYHYNNKGDVVGLTKQNGNSHHNYRYDPYGAVLPENGNFTNPHNHYTLTGKEFDENTGLV